jgi:hypothetical protein
MTTHHSTLITHHFPASRSRVPTMPDSQLTKQQFAPVSPPFLRQIGSSSRASRRAKFAKRRRFSCLLPDNSARIRTNSAELANRSYFGLYGRRTSSGHNDKTPPLHAAEARRFSAGEGVSPVYFRRSFTRPIALRMTCNPALTSPLMCSRTARRSLFCRASRSPAACAACSVPKL